jgi:5-carboxymethyl-2-hydroxymuconate isomerase
MKLQVVIDRFEEDKAILLIGETESRVVWPREYLPQGTEEGDHVEVSFRIDPEATRSAKQEVEDLLRQLLEEK